MRFSFSLVPSPPMAAFGDTIARAASWGYDLAWVPDQGFMQDPFVALSYLTTRTEKIALGVGVTNPYQRHPVQIARAAAALADLRPGGFILGLGAGEKRRIRDRVRCKVAYIGGVSTTASVEKALSEFDFVQVGRALVKDPAMVQHMQEDPKYVNGCNHCNRCATLIDHPDGIRCVLED